MNYGMFVGNAVKDAEMCSSQKTGKLYTRFRLAVDGPYRGPELKREVDFLDFLVFGKRGQMIGNKLKKGQRVAVWGNVKNYRRQDALGNIRESTAIMVRDFEWIDMRTKENAIEELVDSDGEYVLPQEITKSFVRAINVDANDEDMPTDFID